MNTTASMALSDDFNILEKNPSGAIKAIIVEDEIKGLNGLKRSLNKNCKNVTIMAEAFSIKGAAAMMNALPVTPDVAFLDIDLPDGVIFDWLDQLEKVEFSIIFITGYDQYAVKACKYSLIDYLLKPLEDSELVKAVANIRIDQAPIIEQQLEIFRDAYNNPNAFEKFSISALDGIHFVKLKNIVRLEADDNYTHIFMSGNERITTSRTIKSYEEQLNMFNFYRVHKGHIVNMNYMRKFIKGDGGALIMDDDKQIEVSRRRRPGFMERLKKMNGGSL